MHVSASEARIKIRYLLAKLLDDSGAAFTSFRRLHLEVLPLRYFLHFLHLTLHAADTWPPIFERFGDRVREPLPHAVSFLDFHQGQAANIAVVTHPSSVGPK